MLTVLSVNVWGRNAPLGERTGALVRHLREQRPDLVALQEVAGRGSATQAHELAAMAGYPHVATVRTARLRGEGLGLLSTLPLAPHPHVALPSAARDAPRGLLQADVALAEGRLLRLAVTHLAWRLDDTALRVRQAERLVAVLAAHDGPVVLAGDLNDVPGSPPLRVLAAAGFVDAVAGHGRDRPTFDAQNPYLWQPELAGRRVDHVLVRGLQVHDGGVCLDGRDGPVVADHYAVRATLV